MSPNREQIAVAAYHRWLARGGDHGRDREDWAAAERDLLFALNYEPVARQALGTGRVRAVGAPSRRACRFCERPIRGVGPSAMPPLLPPAFGDDGLRSAVECDACHALFREHLEAPFEAFARPFLVGAAGAETAGTPRAIPVAAFKCLVRVALALMPEDELPGFEGTLEWVANPNHRQDLGAIRALGCRAYLAATSFATPSLTLVRRTDDEAPYPAMLLIASTPQVLFQVPLPLATRDDELDGVPMSLPGLPLPENRDSRSIDLPISPLP